MKAVKPLIIAIVVLVDPTYGIAQTISNPVHVRASKIMEARPRVDGKLDELVWQTADTASSFVQREPETGARASQVTRAWVLYDADAIYVGMRMDDSVPGGIAGPLTRRDGGADDSDWAYVMLDPNLDRRSANVFAVNPRGVQKDWLVSDDSREDATWDAVWNVAVEIDSAGWTAEFRIPLGQLRYDVASATWGLNFGRWIARNREYSFWSPWPRSQAGYVSRFGELRGLNGIGEPRRVEVLPYALVRGARQPNPNGNPLEKSKSIQTDAGVDAKAGLTSNLTMSATYNPDFGQVEADPAVVNLTAFETRYSERRPFFVEGSSIFSYEGGEVFYSRRIGRTPQGNHPADARYVQKLDAARILAAAKLSGRTSSGWELGIATAVTPAERAAYVDNEGETGDVVLEPTTHYTVARVKRDARMGETSFGAVMTNTRRWITEPGLDVLPHHATVLGADARMRLRGRYEMRGYLTGSHVEGSSRAMQRLQRLSSRYFQRPDALHVELDSARTSLTGASAGARFGKVAGKWQWELSGSTRSPGFEINDLGYQQEVDRISQRAFVEFNRFEPQGILRQWDVRVSQAADWTYGGELADASVTLVSNFELTNYWSGFVQVLKRSAALSPTALRGGPALFVPGYIRPVVYVRTDRRKPVTGQLLLNARIGTDKDEDGFELESTLEVRTSALRLSVSPAFEWIRYPWQYVEQKTVGGETAYVFGRLEQKELSVGARLTYVFAPTLTVDVFAQPFINAGRFDEFRSVRDARATSPDLRFQSLPDGMTVSNADFSVRNLRSNAILRWEYRPGSIVYLGWTQARNARDTAGSFDVRDAATSLRKAPPTNVLMLKVTHWFQL